VVLVDNNSTDTTLEIVVAFKKTANFSVKIISLKDNIGFGCANNLALKEASGDLIALLNPDAKADLNWLSGLVSAMNRHAEVGVCASKILTWDGERVDSCGDLMLSSLRACKRWEGKKVQRLSANDKSGYVFGACAAAAIYRKKMLFSIGFFDEKIFLQNEDTDLNFRCQTAGWKVFYASESIVYHKVSFSVGRATELSVYHAMRNVELMRIQNTPMPLLILLFPNILMGNVVDFLYFGIKKKMARVFIMAKLDAIRASPQALKRRRLIMKNIRKSSSLYILSVIEPSWRRPGSFWSKLKQFIYR